MSIQVALHHLTEYHYDRPVTILPHIIRLRPAPHCRTPILSYSLKIEPVEQFLNWQQDPYSNYVARLVFPKPSRRFKVEVDLIARMVAINPFDFFLDEEAQKVPFRYDPSLAQELVPYLEIKESGERLLALVNEMRREGLRTNDYIVELNRKLRDQIAYVIRLEPGVQTCEDTLKRASGSCRDSAWLLVQLCRHLGMAARFVSGYLIQLVADEPPLEGPAGPTHDFTDLHAWAEVYLPGAGWVGLDPTSGLLAGEGHLPLACTADPLTAAPVSGSFAWTPGPGCEGDQVGVDFKYAMSVRRVHETPRVTKPYDELQWKAIDALGQAIDEELESNDVRLTMGGEPTFVSIDDRDAAEWNTDALGPTKRKRADVLLRRLRDRFTAGGLLHFGQGKWYPGESLPRWSLSCYWRKDGEPIWRDPQLVGDEGRNYGYGPEDAAAFITHLARELGVNPAHCSPGHEDALYYLWKERRLPPELTPANNKLENPEERARLARVYEHGINRVVGYALPLRWQDDDQGGFWVSGPWSLRREFLYLIPGDSPMGYRLPLESLPWVAAELRQAVHEMDPWQARRPLPVPIRQPRRVVAVAAPVNGTPRLPEGLDPVVRTTLCVEPRDGRLYVFLPPLRSAHEFLDLVAAIEATARDLLLPVQIEGYLPPHDPRLLHFRITPDPGVIEANVHPAAHWPELVDIVQTLYAEARESRLCTEKFMLDGRHVGTGGGNHVVLGGATPADSPFLRRPDLLRSLVSYWHNHPALSYVFGGLFLGPTSQSPRTDEARNDNLHELEIAFAQLPQGGSPSPWLVDRVFRNLLVDITGNTHRTEWCIDKLYSPDSSSGRLGLVEFRAFEMPPHAQMSLVQQLLLRALVARFWDKPYDAKLVRWGTQLHDRFLLPHFLSQDFRDVVDELRKSGYPFEDRWFAPHFEFRFPEYGNVARDGIHLELRLALEPWHVLGEEATAGGTARYVDSSVERLQVKVRGLVDPRHVVLCNGRRVPLHPTGTQGEFVAGVRYRAWQPPSCLHPTIPVHAPLVFDLFDGWAGRSLGGCTYHVAHPGGRAHDTFPVNANEAEGRRLARFFPFGHTPGPTGLPPEERDAEFPLTLDLRRPAPPVPPVPPETFGTVRTHASRMNGNGKAHATPRSPLTLG